MTPPGRYAPPSLLHDLHVLDLLELAGSQTKAGLALAMHQSTVSRSAQLMREQLRLQPRRGAAVCRHGHNDCLQHLRLAYRAHRLMEGVWRIGSDGLHGQLLHPLAAVQLVPPRFRSLEHWVQLIRYGLLDGAIVSSFGFEEPPPMGWVPAWEGLRVRPLGSLRLELVAAAADTQRVVLPAKAAAPLLHQALGWQGFSLDTQPSACQEPKAWLKRARDRRAALPICPQLLPPHWLERHGLVPVADQPELVEQLWLLMPEQLGAKADARFLLQNLRATIQPLKSMQDPHENSG